MDQEIRRSLLESADLKRRIADELVADIRAAAEMLTRAMQAGGTVALCGNGGSAADAQHLAAEFVNRFLINRRPLPALALTTDSSVLTAIGNDFSFDQVFVKQVQALGRPEDLALGISTSGTSANVVKGMQAAREIGMRTAALTGGTVRPGGDLAALCDLVLNVPADSTPHIQETHLWIEHVLCEIVEKQLFGSA